MMDLVRIGPQVIHFRPLNFAPDQFFNFCQTSRDREDGVRLGWLIDRIERNVSIYRPRVRVKELSSPASVSADPVLPGFVLDLGEIWEPDF